MFIAYNPCNDAFKLNELINHFLHAHNKKEQKDMRNGLHPNIPKQKNNLKNNI